MRRLCVVLVAAALGAGCSSKPRPAKPDSGDSTAGKRRGGADARDRKAGSDAVRTDAQDGQGNTVRLGPVYFDFDSVELRPDARDELGRIADYLKKNGSARLTIEGHCDEQGTTEYNLALGDRRARAIRTYLVRLGIGEKRLSVISYGEERPADDGGDENAWAQNRRGELVPDQP